MLDKFRQSHFLLLGAMRNKGKEPVKVLTDSANLGVRQVCINPDPVAYEQSEESEVGILLNLLSFSYIAILAGDNVPKFV